MREREKLHTGQLYDPGDPEIMEEQSGYLELMRQYNSMSPTETDRQAELLKRMLAEVGEGSCGTPPFYANWGGPHLHLGHHVYINMGLTLVDDTHIYIGDCTQLGPNVTIATAGHPILPELRGERPLQYNIPVRIGKNCWIGAGVVIVPGVTIGDNAVVGAGSVVVSDIPADAVAVGNPCRVLRSVGGRDAEYYYKDRKIDRTRLC